MSWRSLPLPASAAVDLPPLLISTTFQEDAYAVHLTDLSHIWSESLDRKAIIRRSRDENSSIDPGSSPDQFAILLKKIRLALAGAKDTTCALTIAAGEERPPLELHLSVELPGGLAPLEWTIQLAPSAESTLRSHLVLPLLTTQCTQRKEINGLRDTIRDKDHVIQKLVDKLESMGTDLGQVFAQAAGKPGRKGEWNRDRVKGMTIFDYEQWKQALSRDLLLNTSDLLLDAFDANDEEEVSVVGITLPDEVEKEDWWTSIGGLTINLNSGKVSTKRGPKNGKQTAKRQRSPTESPVQTPVEEQTRSLPSETSNPEEGAFEPQPNSHPADVDTEDDDDDLDVPQQGRKPIKSPSPLPVPRTKKPLGKIGGKKSSNLEKASQEEAKINTGDEKESEAVDSMVSDAHPAISSKPKKKLGQIGGKKKKDTTPGPEPVIEQEQEQAETQQTAKKKLGIIGHKKDTPKKEEDEEPRGRVSIKPEKSASPPPRETSDDRADRKREQLKRELEQRAKAPVKKKRKL